MQLFYHERNKFKPNNKQRRIQQAQGTPPGNSNNMETPPEKPTGDTNSNNTGTPPEMPTGNTNASNMGTPPNQAQNGTQNPNSQTKIKTNKIIILGIEGLAIAILITYIALSKFNKLTLKETLKSTETKIIFIAITILLTTILTIGQIYIAQNIINKTNNTENTQMMPQEINNSSQTAEATGEKNNNRRNRNTKRRIHNNRQWQKCNISRKWRKRNNRNKCKRK